MEVLIVGGGLAGLCVAEQLTSHGKDVQLIYDSTLSSSTSIATGMYNPVVFRRLNLSWKIETLLPEMHRFFDGVEQRLGMKLNRSISFEKYIPSEDYAALWEKRRTEEPTHTQFMGGISNGYGPVLQAGMIDCAGFQKHYTHYLREKGKVKDEPFDHAALAFLTDGTVRYQDQAFDMIIFCEGPFAIDNPYFNWLPFNLCQGEWIIIETEEEITDKVVNTVTNIIPLGNKRYKLSSTYSWETLDGKPHQKAANRLLEHFQERYPHTTYNVVEHRAALRPTVADRRPYLGRHPEHPQLAIFNGLGSKGVMLAPYFSKQLVAHLFEDKPLEDAVDIQRHIKRYQRSKE